MKIRFLIFAALCVALAVSASAETTWVPSVTSLPAGWNLTVSADSTGRGSVSNKTVAPENGFQFTNGNKDVTSRCWAAMSTTNFDNVPLSSIAYMEIRTLGIEGDGTAWQAPGFVFACKKAVDNLSYRPLTWIPWSDGVARTPGVWNTYNPLVDGSWNCPWVGVTYPTLAAVVAAFPDIRIASDAEIQVMNAGYKGHGFNVGYADYLNEVNMYGDSARGVVDYFSICLTGCNAVCYDLYDVPEPGSLLALATGLIGFIGLRKRF